MFASQRVATATFLSMLSLWCAAASVSAAAEEACHGLACEDEETGLMQMASGRTHMRADDASTAVGDESYAQFGPLSRLIGTWQGSFGLNSMSLPQVDPSGKATSSFTVLVQEYNETLVFEPIMGKVLNRGYKNANQYDAKAREDQVLMGVTYKQKVFEIKTGNLLHEEVGQWLWNMQPGVDPSWTVTRVGIIPHGVVVMAPGEVKNQTGAEVKAEQTEMADSELWSIAIRNPGGLSPGYFEGQMSAACPCRNECPCTTWDGEQGDCPRIGVCQNPVLNLLQHTGEVGSMKALRMQVSTTVEGGALSQLPGIRKQVLNSKFNATFWIESPSGGDGPNDYDQLQYAQTVIMAFRCNNGTKQDCGGSEGLIEWPHVQVNTLTKVAVTGMLGAASTAPLPYIR